MANEIREKSPSLRLRSGARNRYRIAKFAGRCVPTSWDSSPMRPQWMRIGFCAVCIQPIEAFQPGGLNTRHLITKLPLSKCRREPEWLKTDDYPE
jgi:hypothetical protein